MTDIIDRIQKIIEEVKQEHPPVTFAALVEREDSEASAYDLIVSSPWFLSEGKVRSYDYLSKKLSEQLEKEDWHLFNRVLLMKPEEKFVQELVSIAQQYKHRDFINLRAGGINLRFAHIFAADAIPKSIPSKYLS